MTNTCEKILRAKSDHDLTRRFISAKILFRDLSEFDSKLVEHRAQSPFREFKMLAVWLSITEGSPTARSQFTAILQQLQKLMFTQK